MASWPPNLPDQSGRVAIVSGANTGIGLVTAQELARAGARVHLACRNQDKAAAALETIRAEVPGADLGLLPLDLDSLASIRASAEQFLATGEPLHLLVNNAGLVGRGVTSDGFETTFGVNHIGTFHFTNLLISRLRESAPARVVTVASRAHMRCSGIDFDAVRTPTASKSGFPEYCASKLGNVLFTAELGRRLAGTGVTTYAVHPGVVASDVWRDIPAGFRQILTFFMTSVQDGARTSLYCATDPELASRTGKYYVPVKEETAKRLGTDDALAATLWTRTEEWVASVDPGA